MNKLKKTLLLIFIIFSISSYAAEFPSNTKYEVCFTPGNDCTYSIVNEIGKAKHSVYVQAFSFTSEPIEKAIADARTNGIDARVILDKTQENNSAKYFLDHNVPVWIDYKPAIAHNKIIIIDNEIVITGSFNFTWSAQERNAENVLIIHDAGLAREYLSNWEKRRDCSKVIS